MDGGVSGAALGAWAALDHGPAAATRFLLNNQKNREVTGSKRRSVIREMSARKNEGRSSTGNGDACQNEGRLICPDSIILASRSGTLITPPRTITCNQRGNGKSLTG